MLTIKKEQVLLFMVYCITCLNHGRIVLPLCWQCFLWMFPSTLCFDTTWVHNNFVSSPMFFPKPALPPWSLRGRARRWLVRPCVIPRWTNRRSPQRWWLDWGHLQMLCERSNTIKRKCQWLILWTNNFCEWHINERTQSRRRIRNCLHKCLTIVILKIYK